MSYIGVNDLVYTNKDGICSGGFNVQSIMMKGGISPIMTLNNNDKQTGGSTGKVSDIFSGLVVPAYAYYHNGGFKSSSYKSHNSNNDESDSGGFSSITGDDNSGGQIMGIIIIVVLVILIIINAVQYFFSISVTAYLTDFFTNEPKIDIIVDQNTNQSGSSSPPLHLLFLVYYHNN